MSKPHIVVAGAGAIGCFCGGLWSAAGFPVTLLGRAWVLDHIRAAGLRLSDFAGLRQEVRARALTLSEDPGVLAGADLVVAAVKSADSGGMAALIARHAPPAAPVLSFQNGVQAVRCLQEALPERDVRAAMVPFNVVPDGQGGFHRASSGDVVIGAGAGGWGARLSVPGLTVRESARIEEVQWGKLLVNLANALNALSGLTLYDQLRDRVWRRLMADQMAEALRVLSAAGISPVSSTPLPAWMSPHILRLPTPLFTRIAAQMLVIDPAARSSMAQDLMQGRATEIDALQGEIIRLGERHGAATPICRAVAAAIRKAEAEGGALPGVTPEALRAQLMPRPQGDR
ncbi:2-dehydropantoate 2-reductase [Roseobacteraceae bacterium NS-SX3]